MRSVLTAGVLLALTHAAAAQPASPPAPAPDAPAKRAAPTASRVADAITTAVELLLKKQEDLEHADAPEDQRAEWPYEGIYHDNTGLLPMGYRIGGTANTCICLLRAPGYADDPRRQAAVRRAINFIGAQKSHPNMSAKDWNGGYDVRGWGYTYALAFCLELKSAKAVPADPPQAAQTVEDIIAWALDGLTQTEIKGVGGWNYAHSPGRESACPSSPFMTGPTLQALFEAQRQGYKVDGGLITRALDALERCRGSTGAFAYAAEKDQDPERPEPIPGAVGRMLVGEVTLYLAGRSDQARIRAALDAFFTHWEWLNKRRAKPATHIPPYQIAPYYFYYAHYYAAQAIELLPAGSRDLDSRRNPVADADRREYRRRLQELLFSVQLADGSWNDRIFPRTANYGTATSAMALMMPKTAAPARYVPPEEKSDENDHDS